VKKKRKKITIKVPKKGEYISHWVASTPQNFEWIIWDSISAYNYRAQLDIADLLFNQYVTLSKSFPPSNPLIKNICLRILQLYFETVDQFALVCLAVLNKPSKKVLETYLETRYPGTMKFFKRGIRQKISNKEIKKIWGLDTLEKARVTNVKAKKKITMIIKNVIEKTKKNLRLWGQAYLEDDKQTGRTYCSAPLKGSFAIKHGFKLVNPSPLAKEIWKFDKLDDDKPIVMQEVVEITRQDTGECKELIRVGRLVRDNGDRLSKSVRKLVEHIEFFSKEIEIISTIQKGIINDPFFVIGYFAKAGLIKFGRNEACPCGSGKKFKKCHGF
jgi:hypothetical protein